MVAKKPRQSRAVSSKAAPRPSTSAKAAPSRGRSGDKTPPGRSRVNVTESEGTPPSKARSAASGTPRAGAAQATKGSSTSATRAKSAASGKPRAAAAQATKGRSTAAKSAASGKPRRAAAQAPKSATRRAPPASEDTRFDDVPVEPVRRQRRTVATSTGRRRIKHHRPAPHANAPGSAPASADEGHVEDAELAPLPTQTARGEGSREGRTLPIEIDPERIEQSLRKLGGELSQLARRGRYTKVRFRFRGKPLLPDLPLAAVVAAEGLTFYWGGILRALLMNVAGGSLLDVELIHDAEKEIQAGKEALLSGELDRSIGHYQRAVDMQPEGAQAHLNLGIALKLKGERDAAGAALKRALALDPEGPVGAEAKRLLERL